LIAWSCQIRLPRGTTEMPQPSVRRFDVFIGRSILRMGWADQVVSVTTRVREPG
jgi:hypothetical protein